VLFSSATLAIIGGQFAGALFVWTMSNYLPSYFKQVLKMDLRSNGTLRPAFTDLNNECSGILSGAPFLCKMLGKALSSFSSDYVMKRELVRHAHVSKINSTLGSFAAAVRSSIPVLYSAAAVGTSALLVVIAFCTCETKTLAITAMCGAFFFTGFHTGGFMASMVRMLECQLTFARTCRRRSRQPSRASSRRTPESWEASPAFAAPTSSRSSSSTARPPSGDASSSSSSA